MKVELEDLSEEQKFDLFKKLIKHFNPVVTGCYGSQGTIDGVVRVKEDDKWAGDWGYKIGQVIMDSDLCSG